MFTSAKGEDTLPFLYEAGVVWAELFSDIVDQFSERSPFPPVLT